MELTCPITSEFGFLQRLITFKPGFCIRVKPRGPNFRFTTESVSNIAFENILEALSNDRTTWIKP